MRATGAQPTTDANSADATRTTGGVRTSGAMRTAKPIAPGTGKARIVLPVVVLAVILITGGVIGAQLGSRLGHFLKPEYARLTHALIVLAVAVKLALDLFTAPENLFSVVALGAQ